MYYPWLDVPFLTAPAVVALVAIIHVFVSHYAVGGGVLLAMENGRALRDGDAAYRDYWKKHAKFFIGLTVVFGAITGVGIWWTIGLASPLATEALIRIFVFGWAIEWCFFLLEIVAGFIFYYFWDKLSPKKHVAVGWIYALSAWISLVLITGITSFMLNSSGLIDDWERTGNFWQAFLNVQFLPQTVARTGCALIIGTFYVLLHASIVEKNADVREKVTRRMRLPAFLGLVLLVAGVVGWAFFLPDSSLATLERAAATNVFVALFIGIVVGIVLLLLVGPIAKPRETSVGLALALFLMGIAGIGVAEFVREAVRKPFIVDRLVFGNQIYRDDVARLRQNGLLYSGVWTRLYLDEFQEKYPELKISAEKYLGWEPTRPEYWNKIEGLEKQNDADEKPSEPPQEPAESAASAFPVRDSFFVLETVAQATRGGVLPGGGSTTSVPATTRPTAPISIPESTEVFPTTPAPTTRPQTGSAPTSTAASRSNVAISNPTASVAADSNVPVAAPAPLPQNVAPFAAESSAANSLDAASKTDGAELIAPSNGVLPAEASSAVPSDSSILPSVDVADSKPVGEELASSANANSPSDDEADLLEERDLRLNGPIAEGNLDLLKLEESDRRALGRSIFLHHCNDCHADRRGYSAVGPLVVGRTQTELKDFALKLNRSHFYMPPWAGTEVEAELLAEYLTSIAPRVPANIYRKPAEKKVAASDASDKTTLENVASENAAPAVPQETTQEPPASESAAPIVN